MCEISKVQRRIFRDQDPPRIREKAKDNRFLKNESEFSKSTPNSPTALQQRASTASLEKCLSEPGFLEKELKNENCSRIKTKELASFSSTTSLSLKVNADEKRKESSSFVSTNVQDFIVELSTKVPSSSSSSPSFSFCDKKLRMSKWERRGYGLRRMEILKKVNDALYGYDRCFVLKILGRETHRSVQGDRTTTCRGPRDELGSDLEDAGLLQGRRGLMQVAAAVATAKKAFDNNKGLDKR
ncbi:hypothetical protein HZH68_014915 [Vespula germanica]|uniref:Uncharacterized protein n=1 Tax=Vespula germanica TaxID=30212 RepID=A0A834J8L3_VESGE|nr:hypothetical protein HZH68_014915 [Vespula germanica]